MRTWLAAAAVVGIGLSLAGCGLQSNPAAEKAAAGAAEAWLAAVDAGDYGRSWDDAAAFFRNAMPKDRWEQTMQSFRSPFGKKLSRTLKSSRYMTSLPGAPDGQYVVIQFAASFENKKDAVETVTPMLDKDGAWRVSGYFIK